MFTLDLVCNKISSLPLFLLTQLERRRICSSCGQSQQCPAEVTLLLNTPSSPLPPCDDSISAVLSGVSRGPRSPTVTTDTDTLSDNLNTRYHNCRVIREFLAFYKQRSILCLCILGFAFSLLIERMNTICCHNLSYKHLKVERLVSNKVPLLYNSA